MNNDPAQENFADGMTEELINSLAKIEALNVISRTSAMTYRGVKNTAATCLSDSEPQPRATAPRCPDHLDAQAKKERKRLVPACAG